MMIFATMISALFATTTALSVKSIGSGPKAARVPMELLFQENFCKDANVTAIKQCLDTVKTDEKFQLKSNLMKECFGSSNAVDLKAKFCENGIPRPHLAKATECLVKEFKTVDAEVLERFETCLSSVFPEKLIEKKHELSHLWEMFSAMSRML